MEVPVGLDIGVYSLSTGNWKTCCDKGEGTRMSRRRGINEMRLRASLDGLSGVFP
jgi:hypothetical protein